MPRLPRIENLALAALVSAALVTLPSPLSAQTGPRTAAIVTDEDPVPPEPWDKGAEENPDAPDVGQTAKAPVRMGYPMELASRPLTLGAGMIEVGLDMSGLAGPVRARSQVRGAYGIDERIQVGLAYGPGGVDENGFVAGKTVALEGRYLVFDWLAAQVSLPVLLQPFSTGLTVGAPMKFSFADKLAFLFGHDLLSLKVVRFIPVVGDPLATQALIDQDAVNTTMVKSEFRLNGAVIYQLDPDLAFVGEIGIIVQDREPDAADVPLRAALVYSPKGTMDLGVRVGFDNLSDGDGTFGVVATAALRL